MRRLLFIATFASLIAGPAIGADQALRVYRRPVALLAPVYSWTGFYVGGNVGYGWGNARSTIAESGSIVVFPPGTLPGFPGFPGFPSSVAIADSNTAQLNGVIGGAQLGYNYQFNAKWVLGFEADIQGSGQRGSGTFNDSFSIPICVAAQIGTPPPSCVGTGPLSGTTGTEYDARIAWFGTVRGRFGYLITDQVLLYASGGLAYGQVKLSGNSVVNAALTIPPPFGGITVQFMPGGTAFSASKTNVGFSMGGGMEGRFSSWLPANWTWKLEYLYIDLGSLDAATSFASAFPGSGATPLSGPIATHTHFTDNIVRVGLNYKFDNYYTPIVAR